MTTRKRSRKRIAAWRAEIPVQQRQTYEVDIVDLTHEGVGVGKVDGYTLFVREALPGERVLARVTYVKKQYGHAEMISVLRKSQHRVAPPCSVYHDCGGCQLQHMSYDGQLNWKRQMVMDNLKRIGGLEGVTVQPVLGMDDPWRYRNKSQVPIGSAHDQESGPQGKGSVRDPQHRKVKLIAGFYAQGSHRIVDTDVCLIQHERNDRVLVAVKQIGEELGVEQLVRRMVKKIIVHPEKLEIEFKSEMIVEVEI